MLARSGFAVLLMLFITATSAQAQAVPAQEKISSNSSVAAPIVINLPLVMTAGVTAVSPTPVFQWIQMQDPRTGWAITADQQHLIHTRDSGLTWKDVTPAGLAVHSTASFFLDGYTGYVEGAGILYVTGDGGGSWVTYPLPFVGGVIQFADFSNGLAVVIPPGSGSGSDVPGIVYQTADGGKTWTQMNLVDPQGALPAGFPAGSVQLVNGATISVHSTTSMWLGGGTVNSSSGIPMWESKDGGQTWAKMALPLPAGNGMPSTQLSVGLPIFPSESEPIFSVYFTQAGTGGSPLNEMALYFSEDGGDTWAVQPVLVDNVLPTDLLNFVSPTDGYVHCADSVCGTENRGQTWRPMPANVLFTATAGRNMTFLDYMTPILGWAVTSGGLYRTIDGGNNWFPETTKYQ